MKNQILEKEGIIQEDPDIKLGNDLKEMELLMKSLQKIVDENDQIMSLPDNQEEFFLYNNLNNQSFANNDLHDIFNYNVSYNKIYSSNKLDEKVSNTLLNI